MLRRSHSILFLLALALLGGLWFWLDRNERPPVVIPAEAVSAPAPWSIPDVSEFAALSEEAQWRDWKRILTRVVSEVSSDPAKAAELLASLRQLMEGMPPEVASELIRSALIESALNVRTGLGFAVGGNGRLSAAPSLRVALLDWLGQIDPDAAGELAQQIFAKTTDPDEYSISLRNYAWANPRAKNHTYLRERTLDLITNPDWMARPTAGTLEAFDVLVYSRATDAADHLLDLASTQSVEGRAAAYAAFLTLDRLYQGQAKELSVVLEAAEPIDRKAEPMLAQILARADVRQPEVRRHLEGYLRSPNRTRAGLEAFAQVFPNHNFMLSDNLLTEVEIPDGRELRARDLAAYDWVQQKLQDPSFGELRPLLESIAQRLEQFLYPKPSR